MSNTRTRFAPSPTGFLHVGNVRAALYPWLIAKQHGGTFVLRIEDTDQAREVAGAVDVMRETLNWLGITWDEGPDKPGDFGPYTQSERREIYLTWAQKLLAKGRAYADVRSPEELQLLREEAKAQKKPFLARDYRPENPPNWEPGMPLRFLSEPKSYSWDDAIMGHLSSGPEVVDDFIIMKSDGLPTYNFAHIVDDTEMQITHVIRGLEYIASMPKYLNLYEALEVPLPVFAHAPHIMNESGNKKLGKRDGAKGVLEYRAQGFLPETMLNFLASLGWNDGSEKELFTKDELIKEFSLNRVQKSGARFDEQRLIWMNGTYIRELPFENLAKHVASYWPEEAANFSEDYRMKVLGLVQERLKYFAELPDLSLFFFKDLPINLELITTHKQLKKVDNAALKQLLIQSREAILASDFTTEDLTSVLNNLLELTQQKPAVLFSLIRIATTQAPASPGLADTMFVLGKEVTARRLDDLIANL